MLEYGQVVDGLKELAEQFKEQYAQKDYLAATWTYNYASKITTFIKLSEEDIKLLFGNRSYRESETEELYDGLFPEQLVLSAGWWCIQNKKTRQEIVDDTYFMERMNAVMRTGGERAKK